MGENGARRYRKRRSAGWWFQKGWVAANDGNITIRMECGAHSGYAYRVSKGMMHVDDLISRGHEGQ